jgi:DNA repair exonuclease SbcCD nuclease subunit
MIKFLHAADLHLDSPFSSLSPQQAAARRAEQRAQLTSIVELCNDEGCDLLLLAGDLFDSDNAYQDTIDALIRALRTCRAQVMIAPGNHDYYTDASPYATVAWPEHVHIFRSQQVDSIVLPELGCEVYGAAFTAPNAPSLLEGFHVRDEALTNLMVLHGDALMPDSPYNAVTRAQIAASGLDYLALGHIHALGQPDRAGKTTYAWPGCPLGRGFDETGEKGVLLGTIDRGICETRFVPLPGCRYEIFRVAAGDDPLSAIESALPAETEQLICRVILTGEADAVDTRALYDTLSPRCFALTIRDETVPKRDLWADCEGDTLRALFLQTLKAEMDAAPPEEQARYAMAARFGLDVMDGREVPEE